VPDEMKAPGRKEKAKTTRKKEKGKLGQGQRGIHRASRMWGEGGGGGGGLGGGGGGGGGGPEISQRIGLGRKRT